MKPNIINKAKITIYLDALNNIKLNDLMAVSKIINLYRRVSILQLKTLQNFISNLYGDLYIFNLHYVYLYIILSLSTYSYNLYIHELGLKTKILCFTNLKINSPKKPL